MLFSKLLTRHHKLLLPEYDTRVLLAKGSLRAVFTSDTTEPHAVMIASLNRHDVFEYFNVSSLFKHGQQNILLGAHVYCKDNDVKGPSFEACRKRVFTDVYEERKHEPLSNNPTNIVIVPLSTNPGSILGLLLHENSVVLTTHEAQAQVISVS